MEISSNLTSTQSITARVHRAKNHRGFKVILLPNLTLEVRCSLKTREEEIHRFLNLNLDWITKTFLKTKNIVEKFPAIAFVEADVLPLLGENYKIVESHVDTVEARAQEILIPQAWGYSQRKKAIQKFYKHKAQVILKNRVEILAEEMNLKPKEIKFRNNRTLWGSCHPDGTIYFNIKLVGAPLHVIDYVIIHELAHLKIANHSRKFWDLVSQFCTNHRQCRGWLRKNYYKFDFLNGISDLHECKIGAVDDL